MGKISFLIILLLLIPLVSGEHTDGVVSSFALPQSNAQETGELLSDPYLLSEPIFELGEYSEFGFNHEVRGSNGIVNLTWTHSAGHRIWYHWIPYVGFTESDEFARFGQNFTWEHNQTPVTLKISASVHITCTGDFATQDNGDDMYAIWFWIANSEYNQGSYAVRLKMVGNLKDRESYDIELLTSNHEIKQIFAGSIEIDGFQLYSSDTYTMFAGLIPTDEFTGAIMGDGFWDIYEGSVTATFSYFSVEGLLDTENITPPVLNPKINTTTLWNETPQGVALEPLGQSSVLHLSRNYSSGEMVLGGLTSEHHTLWNTMPLNTSPGDYTLSVVEVIGDNIYLITTKRQEIAGDLLLMKLDSQGHELWNTTISLFTYDAPLYLDVSTSGRIYVLAISRRDLSAPVEFTYEVVHSLVCLDNLGNKIWNETLDILNYEEYITSLYKPIMPRGLSCQNDDIFVGLHDSIRRYDSNGDEVWNISIDYDAFCPDPFSGFYTVSISFNEEFLLSKWNTQGVLTWNQVLNIDYGLGWKDYPILERMEVGPDRLLYLILEYIHVNHVMTIARISRLGQLYSQDTIYNLTETEVYGASYRRPSVLDVAITQEGIIHLAVINDSIMTYPFYSPWFNMGLANQLLAYELSDPFVFRVSLESLIITGVAVLIFGGIAWDHFIRGRTRPEDILPHQEEIDPWKILMEKTEDE